MEQEQFQLPPPAVFDVNASINAKQVVPIRPERNGSWRRSLLHAFVTIRTRAFALVVIIGLSVGALAGTLLVNHDEATAQTHAAMQPGDIAASADFAVTGVASPYTSRTVIRHRRTRLVRRLDHAYRVAVIH